jgi:hypothetical protein
LFYKALWPLEKLARRGFHGYPIATVAFYGPDDQQATKVAAGILPAEGAEAAHLQRWFSEQADVRSDPDIPVTSSSSSRVRQPSRSFSWIASSAAHTRRMWTTPPAPRVHSVHSGPIATAGLVRCFPEHLPSTRTRPSNIRLERSRLRRPLSRSAGQTTVKSQ